MVYCQGVYGDNGSLMYHHGYGYAPYAPYSPATSPVPTMGTDGQLYGPQHYQYPHYFQPLTPTSGPYSPNPVAPPPSDVSTSAAPDQKPLPVETANGKSNTVANGGVKGSNGAAPFKPSYQTSSFNSNNTYGRGSLPGRIPASGYQDPRFSFDGMRSPIPWLDGSMTPDSQHRPVNSTTYGTSISNGNNVPSSRNQNYRPNSHYMGLHQPRPMDLEWALVPMVMIYGTNGRGGWLAVDGKYKTRGRGYFGYGNENMDGLNELNRGPRAKGSKNQKGSAPVALAVKEQNVQTNGTTDEEKATTAIPDREQYNKADLPEDYTNAKFFVIKSYSEDDVHKSIKYNVWASTPNGNKKLDAAYQEAQQKSGGCPVFLFFSVNTSGQFVGLAEMAGPVDFNKNVEYWQQDKWTGCFPVTWHVVKDVPNSLLKHITLENNENKPVTNSRDTQEVWEGKPTEEKKEASNGDLKSQKSLEGATDLSKEPTSTAQANGDVKITENGSVAKTGDAHKGGKPVVTEKVVLANGVANGC
ncbi:hypothetical protein Patl1_30064 [Pistacia atlantica]|uniref:Uncharacterized protein n=1 Tax=Pistacia atlantica TaxID=434234 RepID=A0ACC1AC28_9ROSI|nr:hypothetical protein Patl1_30064 [Pistacia atlantica]